MSNAATITQTSKWNAGDAVMKAATSVRMLLTDEAARRELEATRQWLELTMLEAECARAVGDFGTCHSVLAQVPGEFSQHAWVRATRDGLNAQSRDPRKLDWSEERPEGPSLWSRIKRLV
jgi:hypothetical protein